MISSLTHQDKTRLIKEWVFFTGTTKIDQGMGVCYDYAYVTTATGQTITDAWPLRSKAVEFPDQDNCMNFAGVAIQNYPANANGQWIEIYKPGSVCMISVGCNVTAGNIASCSAGQGGNGRFSRVGQLYGKGAAKVLQTDASVVLASQLIGVSTCALDTTGKILTDSVADFVTSGVAAGDRVVVTSGENDGTDYAIPGEYVVASVTSAHVLVLTEAASTTGGTMEVNYYIVSGNPMVLAELLDGQDCGLHEVVQPPTTGGAATLDIMEYGKTFLVGDITLTEDSIHTMANGSFIGQKKLIECLGTFAGHDAKLAFTGSFRCCIQSGNYAHDFIDMTTLEFNGAGDKAFVIYNDPWQEVVTSDGVVVGIS
jgi:hypothetical protein